ncbi:hypothetical protein JTE90_009766 [Oedothorax gibbosus]|uniref:Uncharacterized protein n=1 Tax=Oedothorax gibbosus TaxID=931172 RepID=A0AAV6V7S3_9ARAC|nr:hypothetical protein JTE90_009766 [Oedothorax gibbosus]
MPQRQRTRPTDTTFITPTSLRSSPFVGKVNQRSPKVIPALSSRESLAMRFDDRAVSMTPTPLVSHKAARDKQQGPPLEFKDLVSMTPCVLGTYTLVKAARNLFRDFVA